MDQEMKLDLTPFEKFDLLPLSFSKASKFLNDPPGWYISYIEKIKLGSAPMTRGTCAEHGVFRMFEGVDRLKAIKESIELFDEGVKDLVDDPKVEVEREKIPHFIQGFYNAIKEYEMVDYQEEQNFKVCGVPIIGYTDFGLKGKDMEFKLDLKSSGRMPKKLSHSIELQQSLYAFATNQITKVLYCVVNRDKKSETKWFDITQQDASKKLFVDIIVSMHRFLSRCESKDDIRKEIVPNLDYWLWDYDPRLTKIRKKIWGY
jgi:hypothetical protein